MKKIIKKLLILAFVGLIIAAGIVYYVFNKPHRNIEDEKPMFKMEAQVLFTEYSENEVAGNMKFGDKTIEVSGKIIEITKTEDEVSIVLNDEMESVNCALSLDMIIKNKIIVQNIKIGDNITLKGKCDGFDMIMGVVLTECYIITN